MTDNKHQPGEENGYTVENILVPLDIQNLIFGRRAITEFYKPEDNPY